MIMYIFDHYAILYMLEQFPRNIASTLWEIFIKSCDKGVIISHRESQKLLDQNAVDVSSLEWSKKHSSIFKKTSTKEAELLGVMMEERIFSFLCSPTLNQRRIPEALPFILCAAKVQQRVYVYRKNAQPNLDTHIKSICKRYEIPCMEVEECLMCIRNEEIREKTT